MMEIFLLIVLPVMLVVFLKISTDTAKKTVYDELLWIGKKEINISWVGGYVPSFSYFDRTRLGSIFRVTYTNADGKKFDGRCAVYWMPFNGFETKWLNKS